MVFIATLSEKCDRTKAPPTYGQVTAPHGRVLGQSAPAEAGPQPDRAAHPGDPESIFVTPLGHCGFLKAMAETKCEFVAVTGNIFLESRAAGVGALRQNKAGLTAIFAMGDQMGAAVVNAQWHRLQRRATSPP